MSASTFATPIAGDLMSVELHKLSPADAQIMQNVRAMLAENPKLRFVPENRPAYDEIIARAPAPEAVSFSPGNVDSVPGWWVLPDERNDACVILYLHGGGYVLGSAAAYRNFVGHIACRAGACAFIADYALAPERPFPAAFDDIGALRAGLLALGYERVALVGDSAGAGLALSFVTRGTELTAGIACVAAMSPWIDLSVLGASMTSRAEVDPILSRETLAEAATLYLGAHSATDDRVSTLHRHFPPMPPVRIDVGDAEVVLDDALRFEQSGKHTGQEFDVHVWEGMVHVFPTNFLMLQAGAEALEGIGAFLSATLARQ